MKKQVTVFAGLALILVFLALSCAKKKSTGIAPGYKAENGTGGNPNANNPTVTGSTQSNNLATQNSNLVVGGSGWSNPTCGSTNSLTLKGINGNINVTITFASIPTTNTFVVGTTGPNGCNVTVNEAPNQPAGIVWIGKSGQVVVNVSASSINATLSNVQCVQQTFNYPVVSVSGVIGCSQ